MKTTYMIMTSEFADAGQLAEIKPYVVSYMETGNLPIEIFNQLEVSASPEVNEVSESGPADESFFGTHIREAIDVLRGRQK